VDNGWAAAPDWAERVAAAEDLLRGAARAGRAVAVLATGETVQDVQMGDAGAALERMRALKPAPHTPDRLAMLLPMGRFLAREPAAEIIWISDGIAVDASANVVGALAANTLGFPWPLAVLACLAAGGFAGLVNGVLITKGNIPPFIVTLGMLGVARGLGLVLTNGLAVYGLPPAFTYLGQGRPLGIPTPVIILLVTVVIAHVVLAHTRFGLYTQVIGDNETAARAMGIRVDRHKIALYTLSGVLAGLAGMLFAARVNAGDPTAGINYELTAITAAIIGGTNLFGGRGTVIGTVIGALIMGVLQNGLNLLAVPSFYQQMAIGAVLVLAVWIDGLNRNRGARRR
ncbi:MAG: ABC transporter permease, partial [Hyphomicrobiales bacterium]